MSVKTLQILVTGDPEELRDRLPEKTQNQEQKLDWYVLKVLKFEPIPISDAVIDELVQKPFDWIIFASTRAVRYFVKAIKEKDRQLPASTKIAVVGNRTAEVAKELGLTTSFVPSEPGSEAFIDEFRAPSKTARILIPGAESGRKLIGEELSQWGCTVVWLPVYRTQPEVEDAPEIAEVVKNRDVFLFTSPSSIDAFTQHFEKPSHGQIVCMGDYTSERLTELGWNHKVLPQGDFNRIGEAVE